MKKLFVYKRTETKEGEESKTFIDSINVDKIIRTVEMEDGTLLVLLDDIHQRLQEQPVMNKQGKITAYKNVMGTFQSEIYLSEEEKINFYKFIENE